MRHALRRSSSIAPAPGLERHRSGMRTPPAARARRRVDGKESRLRAAAPAGAAWGGAQRTEDDVDAAPPIRAHPPAALAAAALIIVAASLVSLDVPDRPNAAPRRLYAEMSPAADAEWQWTARSPQDRPRSAGWPTADASERVRIAEWAPKCTAHTRGTGVATPNPQRPPPSLSKVELPFRHREGAQLVNRGEGRGQSARRVFQGSSRSLSSPRIGRGGTEGGPRVVNARRGVRVFVDAGDRAHRLRRAPRRSRRRLGRQGIPFASSAS